MASKLKASINKVTLAMGITAATPPKGEFIYKGVDYMAVYKGLNTKLAALPSDMFNYMKGSEAVKGAGLQVGQNNDTRLTPPPVALVNVGGGYQKEMGLVKLCSSLGYADPVTLVSNLSQKGPSYASSSYDVTPADGSKENKFWYSSTFVLAFDAETHEACVNLEVKIGFRNRDDGVPADVLSEFIPNGTAFAKALASKLGGTFIPSGKPKSLKYTNGAYLLFGIKLPASFVEGIPGATVSNDVDTSAIVADVKSAISKIDSSGSLETSGTLQKAKQGLEAVIQILK